MITLNEKQLKRKDKWLKSLGSRVKYEKEVAPSSPLVYVVRPGSISDEVIVYLSWAKVPKEKDLSCDLSLGDDGEFITEV